METGSIQMALTSAFHSNNTTALDRCNHTLTRDLDNKALCFQYHKTNINILGRFFFKMPAKKENSIL